jgi:DnaJ family protein B protein 12
VDPEDIFNMFFGGGMPGGQFQQRRPQQRQQHHQQQQQGEVNPLAQLMQLMPILLLFMMSFFNGFPATSQSAAPFSLHAQGTYHVPMTTRDNVRGIRGGIKYWVQDDFHKRYGRDRRSVETSVQQTFHDTLHSECVHQRNSQKRMIYKAKSQRRKADRDHLLAEAERLDTSACDEFQRWFS